MGIRRLETRDMEEEGMLETREHRTGNGRSWKGGIGDKEEGRGGVEMRDKGYGTWNGVLGWMELIMRWQGGGMDIYEPVLFCNPCY